MITISDEVKDIRDAHLVATRGSNISCKQSSHTRFKGTSSRISKQFSQEEFRLRKTVNRPGLLPICATLSTKLRIQAQRLPVPGELASLLRLSKGQESCVSSRNSFCLQVNQGFPNSLVFSASLAAISSWDSSSILTIVSIRPSGSASRSSTNEAVDFLICRPSLRSVQHNLNFIASVACLEEIPHNPV
jgi:hypothetical protein